ncbi:unnamed protein product [Paramecium sonneborni]|uniref:LITAF domain-containing protein n=1 Tax=Paramecium sonneborni TaxID=65129 RepID=A0A8S1PCC7_9CILI|nr:unnamed protein product [Paramecium sonneborni]
MQTQIKSQLYQEENIPIKISQQEQKKSQLHDIELNQQERIQQSSIPVYEKTRLPKDSNIYMNKSKIPGFQEVAINWPQGASFQQQSIVAQQVYSEVNQQQQMPASQLVNQQFMMPQSKPYQPGSGIPTHKDLTQIPKTRHSEYLQCRWCNQEVHSQVEYRIGLTQFILCLILSPAFLLGLIFVFSDICKDCYHFCTNCSCEMGVVKLIDFSS